MRDPGRGPVGGDGAGSLDQAAEILARPGPPGAALTGAGISVESGIPDFRSPGGLWERFDPLEYATIGAFRKDPEKVWRMLVELEAVLVPARPNAGHQALARLEELGRLGSVITQNIDGLHQAAGSSNVIEFHGNGRRLVCVWCGRSRGRDEEPRSTLPPRCDCGRILKPNAVFFGEPIPEAALGRSHEALATASFLLVVGTSATVAPASEIPYLARSRGIPVLEVNLEPTELTGRVADLTILGPAGEILPDLVRRIECRLRPATS